MKTEHMLSIVLVALGGAMLYSDMQVSSAAAQPSDALWSVESALAAWDNPGGASPIKLGYVVAGLGIGLFLWKGMR